MEKESHFCRIFGGADLPGRSFGRIALYFDPRPFVAGHFTPLLYHIPDNGFPSDHLLLVSVIAMIGTYWNKKLGAVLWILAVIIAIARVYVGVHHVIDVVGSMVIAIAVTMMVRRIIFILSEPKNKY